MSGPGPRRVEPRDPDGRHGPHVFVPDLHQPRLADDDRHHLERVVRLVPGDPLTVADGRGRWRPGRLAPDGAVEPTGDVVAVPRPEPRVTIAFVPVKADRPEWTVQKLTEVGVDRIVVFASARRVVRWEGERARRHLDRLVRVAREAAAQCRRSWLPDVDLLGGFDQAVALPGACLAERDGQAPDLAHPTVLVGPEGGWSDAERAVELPRVALAEHVLRAETAAVAAGLLLGALRSGRVTPR